MNDTAAGSIYERIGGAATIERVVETFYRNMNLMPQAQTIRAMHGDGLTGMKIALKKYLTEWTGGPGVYSSEKGNPHMRERHATFPIDNYARDIWMDCMDQALEEQIADADVRAQLRENVKKLADQMRNTK